MQLQLQGLYAAAPAGFASACVTDLQTECDLTVHS